MSFKIGFAASSAAEEHEPISDSPATEAQPRKSVARVFFPERNFACSYYNDMFDLHEGDTVFVEGKLEGLCGIVEEVSYSFKIKLSDYKRVISKADTAVHGELFFAGSHMVAFDRKVIPYEKVASWVKAPTPPEEEFAVGSSGESILLATIGGLVISSSAAQAGNEYYADNRVIYICVDGAKGRAIVVGRKPYDLEFTLRNGEVTDLVCGCYCAENCKHELAALLQLRETLDIITDKYADEYERSGYFAAVSKGKLMQAVIGRRESGKLILG